MKIIVSNLNGNREDFAKFNSYFYERFGNDVMSFSESVKNFTYILHSGSYWLIEELNEIVYDMYNSYEYSLNELFDCLNNVLIIIKHGAVDIRMSLFDVLSDENKKLLDL